MEDRYTHPQLGEFTRNCTTNHLGDTFCNIIKKGPVVIPGLKLELPEFNFFLKNRREITESEGQELIELINITSDQINALEKGILEKYRGDIYPTYKGIYLRDWKMTEKEVAELLPDIESSRDIWILFGAPRSLNFGTWGDFPVMSFFCKFDQEHDLHISFRQNRLDDVWTE